MLMAIFYITWETGSLISGLDLAEMHKLYKLYKKSRDNAFGVKNLEYKLILKITRLII